VGTSSALAINNAGEIIVDSGGATLLRAPDGTYTTPVPPPGYTGVGLRQLNDLGATAAIVSIGATQRAAIRAADGGYVIPFTTSPSNGIDVNNAGELIATVTLNGPAFLYRPSDGVTFIPPPPGATRPELVSINNGGVVAGNVGVNNVYRGFTYTAAAGSVLLPTVDDLPAILTDINDSGTMVGTVGGLGSAIRPYRWNPDGSLEDLGGPGGLTVPQAINNRGDVVGSLIGTALLWSSDYGAAVDLNTFLTPEELVHWRLWLAYDINDARQIVGYARYDPDGAAGPQQPYNRAFLLNLDVPEPAAGAQLLLGILLLRRSSASRRVS
jgi:hypothetical protein